MCARFAVLYDYERPDDDVDTSNDYGPEESVYGEFASAEEAERRFRDLFGGIEAQFSNVRVISFEVVKELTDFAPAQVLDA